MFRTLEITWWRTSTTGQKTKRNHWEFAFVVQEHLLLCQWNIVLRQSVILV